MTGRSPTASFFGLSVDDWTSDVLREPVHLMIESYEVGNDFFELYEIPLLRGRTFQPGDVVHAFVELTAGRAAGASVAVTATLHDAKGNVVLTRDVTAVPERNQPVRGTIELPIEDTPGRYVLRFEARAGTGGPIAREVRFEIGAPSR